MDMMLLVDEYIFGPYLGMVDFLLINVLYIIMCCCMYLIVQYQYYCQCPSL